MLLFTEQLGERDASELMEGCDRPWPLWPLLCKESFTPTATLLYYSKKIAHCEDVVHGDKPVIFVIRSYSSSSVPSALCQLFWQKHPSPWALHPYCHWHSNLSCESHLCPAALCCADPAWGGTDSGHQQLSTAGVSVPPTWSRSQFTYMIIFLPWKQRMIPGNTKIHSAHIPCWKYFWRLQRNWSETGVNSTILVQETYKPY